MHLFKSLVVFACAAIATVKSNPVDISNSAVEKRGAVLSGQWDTESEASGYFLLYNNLWGESAGTGSQTTQATNTSSHTVAWKTTYSWSGGPYNVKSYANLALQTGLGKAISAIKSMPTTWDWTYTSASSSLVADVSYDLWLSSVSTGTGSSSTSTYEIMIWLSTRGGAGPAGSKITTVTVNGRSWNLFKGTVSTWTVFSYTPAGSEITAFNEDIKPFLTNLVNTQGVPSSNFVVGVQAGTEPFVGSATLTTTAYTVAVN